MFDHLIEILKTMHAANPEQSVTCILDRGMWRSLVIFKNGVVTGETWKPSIGAISHNGQVVHSIEQAREVGTMLAR